MYDVCVRYYIHTPTAAPKIFWLLGNGLHVFMNAFDGVEKCMREESCLGDVGAC